MPTSLVVGGPQPVEARQGRHKQRYGDNGERLVAGCIPIRFSKGDGSRSEDIEVLLISSRGGKGYCFPKGGWEDDESVEYAAMRETVEEAGVRGTLETPMLGTFPFSSGKSSPDIITRHQGRCIAHIFVMHVAEELDMWPERDERKRFWCPLSATSAHCRYDWMREALSAWIQRKGWLHLIEQEQHRLQQLQQTQQQRSHLVSVSSDVSAVSDSLDHSAHPTHSPGPSKGSICGATLPPACR